MQEESQPAAQETVLERPDLHLSQDEYLRAAEEKEAEEDLSTFETMKSASRVFHLLAAGYIIG